MNRRREVGSSSREVDRTRRLARCIHERGAGAARPRDDRVTRSRASRERTPLGRRWSRLWRYGNGGKPYDIDSWRTACPEPRLPAGISRTPHAKDVPDQAHWQRVRKMLLAPESRIATRLWNCISWCDCDGPREPENPVRPGRGLAAIRRSGARVHPSTCGPQHCLNRLTHSRPHIRQSFQQYDVGVALSNRG